MGSGPKHDRKEGMPFGAFVRVNVSNVFGVLIASGSLIRGKARVWEKRSIFMKRRSQMKKNIILSMLILVLFFIFTVPCLPEEKKEDSPGTGFLHDFAVHGFLRYEPSIHIGGRNWNNDPLQKDNNTLNLSRSWLQIQPQGNLGDYIKFYGNFRFINESADNLDSNVHHFEAFPMPFTGNGSMLRVGRKSTTAEVWELFTDVEIKPLDLRFRIGKQTVAWGEPIAIRVFDVVNSLDLSWHGFYEPALDEFDNTRIPMWSVRAIKGIPKFLIFSGNTLDVVVSYFEPQILPALGSPYNMVPSYVEVREKMSNNRTVFAGRFSTMLDVGGGV